MSLILDALNRSKQEESPVPGLATQHAVEPVENGRWYLPWVALAVAVVLIAWLLIDRYRTPQESPAELGAPVAELSRNIGSATASVTNALRSRAAESEEKARTGAVDQQLMGEAGIAPEPKIAAKTETEIEIEIETAAKVVNVVAKPSEPAASPVPNQENTLPEPDAAAPVVENTAVAALYENRVPDEPVVTKSRARPQGAGAERDAGEETIDIEKVLARVREESENTSLMEHPVPLLSTMSQHTKDDIPTLYYQQHDYSNELSGSSVVLNGKEVKVGGSPVSGMKVEEILPDSVVLNYRGTQFRLRALNSWVNL